MKTPAAKAKDKVIHIRIDSEQAAQIDAAARKAERKVSDWARLALIKAAVGAVLLVLAASGCQEPLIIPVFGNGSDGNCVFDNDESGCLGVRHVGGIVYELQRDVQARNATFIGHALLLTQGHKLLVKDRLDLTQASLAGFGGVQ